MIKSEKINQLSEEIKQYIENRLSLLKLEATEAVSDSFGEAISFLIIGTVGLILFFLISILGGISLSIWLNNFIYGFGIIAGIYLIIFLLLLIFRKNLIKIPFQNKFIQYLLREDEEFEH